MTTKKAVRTVRPRKAAPSATRDTQQKRRAHAKDRRPFRCSDGRRIAYLQSLPMVVAVASFRGEDIIGSVLDL
jgi:hypothetical protein